MICLCSSYGCEDARPYYFDVLREGSSGSSVPPRAICHVQACGYCQSQLQELERLLDEVDEVDTDGPRASDDPSALLGQLLGLHFAYLEHGVSCAAARPFLPTLLDDTLAIRIETPITVHVDHCEACRSDMEALQGLGLSSSQLYRLGQFLAEHGQKRMDKEYFHSLFHGVPASRDEVDEAVLDERSLVDGDHREVDGRRHAVRLHDVVGFREELRRGAGLASTRRTRRRYRWDEWRYPLRESSLLR